MTSSLAIILSIWEGLIQWLAEKYPDLLVLTVFGLLVWFLTHRWDRFYNRFKTTEKLCLENRNAHIPDLHSKFTGIDRKLTLVLASVQKISMYLVTTAGLDSKIFEAKSPLQLTALGDDILKRSAGKEYVDKMLNDLVKVLEIKKPKSGLDVQNFSHTLLTERSLEDDFVHIKNFVYQNPTLKSGEFSVQLDMGMIIQIMSIYLRNKYLDQHPDVPKD